jgi:hypothetical protein
MSDCSGGRGFRGGLRHLPHLTVRAQQLRQFWAKRFSGVLCTPILSLQFVEQRLGLLEISGIKALGEPAVDRREECVRFGPLALVLPNVLILNFAPATIYKLIPSMVARRAREDALCAKKPTRQRWRRSTRPPPAAAASSPRRARTAVC